MTHFLQKMRHKRPKTKTFRNFRRLLAETEQLLEKILYPNIDYGKYYRII